MARFSPESFSIGANATAAGRGGAAVVTARAGFVGVVGLSLLLGVVAMLFLAGPVAQAPDLAGLIRGMVALKGLILGAAVAAVLWRLGRPTPAPVVLGYTLALGTSAAAVGWLWGLSLIPLGSALFYGGLIAAFLVAGRDRGFFDGVFPDRRS